MRCDSEPTSAGRGLIDENPNPNQLLDISQNEVKPLPPLLQVWIMISCRKNLFISTSRADTDF